jgi:hypothetical protein
MAVPPVSDGLEHPARFQPKRTRREDRLLQSSTGYGTTSLSEREIRDVSNSTVVWLGRFRIRAAASGVELDQEWAMHGLWANHKVVQLNTFRSWIDALKAVGLEE